MEVFDNQQLAEQKYIESKSKRRTMCTLVKFFADADKEIKLYFLESSISYEGHQLANRLAGRIREYNNHKQNSGRHHVLDIHNLPQGQEYYLGESINSELDQDRKNIALDRRNKFLNDLARIKFPKSEEKRFDLQMGGKRFDLQMGGHAEEHLCLNFSKYLTYLYGKNIKNIKTVNIRISHSPCTTNDLKPSCHVGFNELGCLNKLLTLANSYRQLTFNVTFDQLFGYFAKKENNWESFYSSQIIQRNLDNITFV